VLHLDERVHGPAEGFRRAYGCAEAADPFLHTGHNDLVLLLNQVEQDSLRFDEVRGSLNCKFGDDGNRLMLPVGKSVPQSLHCGSVLTHSKINEEPLGGKKAFYALLNPSGHQGEE
jgi:hypothetical protein